MADNDPNQSGGVPPKPADAPKVQPKKETVRISLPPKPTSTSTIKLPSLPAGGKPPAAAPSKPPGGAMPTAPKPPGSAPQAPKPPAAAPPGARVAKPPGAVATSAPRPAAPAAPARGRAAAARTKSSPLDAGLTIAAGILGIAAVVSLLLLLNMK